MRTTRRPKPGIEPLLENKAEIRVAVPRTPSNRKGVSVAGAVLPLSALTNKDRHHLFAFAMGAQRVAFLFVQRPQDMGEVRALVGKRDNVMAKLEEAHGNQLP
jgi:pyruvate kinase